MSKTKGNVIDPLPVMDEFGTDALRFTLLVGSTPGNDTNLEPQEGGSQPQLCQQDLECRPVCDLGDQSIRQSAGLRSRKGRMAGLWPTPGSGRACKRWSATWSGLFQTYQYGEAGRQIYEFFWNDFADWYVEIAKQQMQKEETRGQTVTTLVRVLDMCLRLLHPFTPFVTEEFWGHLRQAVLRFPAGGAGGRLAGGADRGGLAGGARRGRLGEPAKWPISRSSRI